MRIPLPSMATQQIARRAVEIIKTTAPKKTAKAVNAITPSWQDGIVEIEIPPDAEYILQYDQGKQAEPMTDVAGRVIPIREPDGTIAFRKVSTNKVGQIPIVNRAAEDGQISDGRPMWVRQAQPALSFIDTSVERSTAEWERTVKPDDIIKILQQSNVAEFINTIMTGGRY